MLKFEIRQIDAWENEDGNWYWNNSYKIGEFLTRWKDEKRAFLYHLHNTQNLTDNGQTYAFCNFSDDWPQYGIPMS